LDVRPFDDSHVGSVVRWVGSADELRWLAPSTDWPLTVEKVRAWRRGGGGSYGLYLGDRAEPIGHGELNPMRANPSQLWMGHIIVAPSHRRLGFGRRFVTELARLAFERYHAERLILVVFPSNTTALNCYMATGFRTVGEEFHVIGHATTDRPPRRHRLIRLELLPTDRRA